jgi:alpha-beta hydrolase superfamily lysophospholipase
MQHEEFYLQMSDGFTLYGQGWHPESEAKAAICLVHGLGEHTGRYAHVAEKLVANGYAILGCDLRGHGKTGGPRGHFPNYEQVMKDIQSILAFLKEKYPTQPTFLYGHSMGGSIALNYCLRMKPVLSGVVATSPGLKPGTELSSTLLALGKILYSVVPTFGLDNGLDRNNLSRDLSVIERYNADPLVHPKISARFAMDFLSSGTWALEHASEFALPLLIQVGSLDHLVSVPAIREFAQKAPGVEFKEWQGLFHETHNEPEKEQVLDTMVDWLNRHLT